jgi:hypothetical protein
MRRVPFGKGVCELYQWKAGKTGIAETDLCKKRIDSCKMNQLLIEDESK